MPGRTLQISIIDLLVPELVLPAEILSSPQTSSLETETPVSGGNTRIFDLPWEIHSIKPSYQVYFVWGFFSLVFLGFIIAPWQTPHPDFDLALRILMGVITAWMLYRFIKAEFVYHNGLIIGEKGITLLRRKNVFIPKESIKQITVSTYWHFRIVTGAGEILSEEDEFPLAAELQEESSGLKHYRMHIVTTEGRHYQVSEHYLDTPMEEIYMVIKNVYDLNPN